MKTSINGINLIKSFEGCRLTAYKPVSTEKYYTIGYGHYGADVKENMRLSQSEAEALLVRDLLKFETAVEKYNKKYKFNQNQFDALVSFTFNCGAGNLAKLLAYGTRPMDRIADKMLGYNKSSGKVLPGLTNRRKAEAKLFNIKMSRYIHENIDYGYVFDPAYYYNNNPDIRVLGRDSKLLFEHFIVFGMKERRQAKANFNVEAYLKYNPDVKQSVTGKGTNWIKAYQHYCLFGHNENGRRTTE